MNKIIILFCFMFISEAIADTTCRINNVVSVDFGTINPLSNNYIDTVGQLTLDCNGSVTSYSISMSSGSGSMSQRVMNSGPNLLNYNLYTTNNYLTVWGDGSGTSVKQNGSFPSPGNNSRNFSIYGRIPILNQANIATGDYSDSIVITVMF